MDDQLGLAECVSIALGGMTGGGIYAVLGVVAGVTGRRRGLRSSSPSRPSRCSSR